jgi:hypothetical protein
MKWRLIAAVIVCMLVTVTAHAKATSRRNVTVVETFRTLDRHFTLLDAHLNDLEKRVNAPPAKSKSASWRASARAMKHTTSRIERISAKMAAHYRKLSKLGAAEMFKHLQVKAKDLERELALVSKSKAAARKRIPQVQKAALNLVLQFQAISSGYAAAHCDPGAWSCGVPKKEVAGPGLPTIGVKWVCVNTARKCGGLLGFRTPPLATKPVTVANSQSR